MLLICALSVIISSVLAQDQAATRVNKPKTPYQNWRLVDNVRCFCNLPSCVGTGYLCKSKSGCFSDFPDTRSSPGRHGCLEFLPFPQKSICLSNKNRPQALSNSLLVCCTTDLCNHVDSPNAKLLLNNTLVGEDGAPLRKFHQHNQEELLYSNSEVWFRAATIAVPICGAVILFVLVALAVKILKKDHQNSIHKLSTATYVLPPEEKNKWNGQKYNPLTCKNPYYSSAFTVKPEEPIHGHIEIPLLVSNDLRDGKTTPNSVNESKNHTNSKLNYKQCEVTSSCEFRIDMEKDSLDFANSRNILLNSQTKTYEDKKTFPA